MFHVLISTRMNGQMKIQLRIPTVKARFCKRKLHGPIGKVFLKTRDSSSWRLLLAACLDLHLSWKNLRLPTLFMLCSNGHACSVFLRFTIKLWTFVNQPSLICKLWKCQRRETNGSWLLRKACIGICSVYFWRKNLAITTTYIISASTHQEFWKSLPIHSIPGIKAQKWWQPKPDHPSIAHRKSQRESSAWNTGQLEHQSLKWPTGWSMPNISRINCPLYCKRREKQ